MPSFFTRSGDQGESVLLGGKSLSKASAIFEALGILDELNAVLGILRAEIKNQANKKLLRKVQDIIHRVSADLATPKTTKPTVRRIEKEDLLELERLIGKIGSKLPPIRKFIVPGTSPSGAWLHLARALARRAEREVIGAKKQGLVANPMLIPYLNRLSSLFFVLALREDWKKSKKKLEHPSYT